ncbi:uncharacterized protein METZ01_LOCUS207344, partial [marine metagenome]
VIGCPIKGQKETEWDEVVIWERGADTPSSSNHRASRPEVWEPALSQFLSTSILTCR